MHDRAASCYSRWNRHEPLLHELLVLLFAQSLLGGAVLDAGAHVGVSACFFCKQDDSRTVYAVEPMQANIQKMKRKFGHLSNLHIIRAALGSKKARVSEDQVEHRRGMLFNIQPVAEGKAYEKRLFDVQLVDDIFRDVKLAFARFDTHGNELDIIRGANRTIVRDRPVAVLEIDPLVRNRHANELLRIFTEVYNYRAFFVPERAGEKNERNVICVPRERRMPPLLAQKTIEVSRRNFNGLNIRRLLRLTAFFRSTPRQSAPRLRS